MLDGDSYTSNDYVRKDGNASNKLNIQFAVTWNAAPAYFVNVKDVNFDIL